MFPSPIEWPVAVQWCRTTRPTAMPRTPSSWGILVMPLPQPFEGGHEKHAAKFPVLPEGKHHIGKVLRTQIERKAILAPVEDFGGWHGNTKAQCVFAECQRGDIDSHRERSSPGRQARRRIQHERSDRGESYRIAKAVPNPGGDLHVHGVRRIRSDADLYESLFCLLAFRDFNDRRIDHMRLSRGQRSAGKARARALLIDVLENHRAGFTGGAEA